MSSADSKPNLDQVPCILVVDDIPRNIQVVGGILAGAGYDIIPATSGRQALERASQQVPDLVLLDLMMPEMDGIEVCRRFKQNPHWAPVPVIFLTASSEHEHLIHAFQAGAVDYVVKPFNPTELLVRVWTHLELKTARDRLADANRRLRELNDEKNEFLGIVAHDLRNPLNNVIGACELLKACAADSETAIRIELAGLIARSAEHMNSLVKELLDVNAIERGAAGCDLQPVDVAGVTESSVEVLLPRAEAKGQAIVVGLDRPSMAMADPLAVREIVDNLLSNAVKYSPTGRPILVRVRRREGWIRIEVRDEGPGLSAEDKRKLFGKFARLSARPTGGEQSVGLGLSIVKRLVENCRGHVWCESESGKGSTFVVELTVPAVVE